MSDTGAADSGQQQQEQEEPSAGTDWEAEAKKWKADAEEQKKLKRRVEDLNKKNMSELEKLQAASLTEQEKAVAAARTAAAEEARQETLRTVGHRLVDAEVRTAAAGRGLNVDALLDGLDRSRFLGEDLEPDTRAIEKWVEAVAPAPKDPSGFDIGQGARGNGEGQSSLTHPEDSAFAQMLLNAAGGRRQR